jgi:hypothetical protein
MRTLSDAIDEVANSGIAHIKAFSSITFSAVIIKLYCSNNVAHRSLRREYRVFNVV